MDTGQHATLGELSLAALTGVSLPTLTRQVVTLVAHQLNVEYSTIWELLPACSTFLLQAESRLWAEGAAGQEVVGADMTSFPGHALLRPARRDRRGLVSRNAVPSTRPVA